MSPIYLLQTRSHDTACCSPVEIPTRCSFVIEFIIPKFFAGSTCFKQHTGHCQGWALATTGHHMAI